MSSKECSCNAAPKLIFSCSGAADVGEISDRAARKLSREGSGKMYCLAGIGAGLNTFVETTKAAGTVLAIDGCQVGCAKKILENNGFTDFKHICITDSGFEKGKSPATDEAVKIIAEKGESLLKGACS